jgi:hypothetical protein
MTFYDLNVTKPIYKSNGVVNLGPGGQASIVRLNLGGILDRIGLITQGTPVMTATVTRDVQGPFNIYSNISVIPNQQVPIVSISGYGLALFNMLKYGLENDDYYVWDLKNGNAITNSPDVFPESWINGGALVTTAGFTAPAPVTLNIPHVIPICQGMFNGIVGYWELGNPLAQLTVQLIPAYIGSASPFQIASNVGGSEPYTGTAIPGTNNATLANPTVDVIRYLWDTPINPKDRPPVTLINTIIEDTFQNNVGSSNQLKYAFAPLSGYVARCMTYVYNGTGINTGTGVDPSLGLASNYFQFGIGDGTILVSENVNETNIRQRRELGFDLPRGTTYLDFLGKDLTFQSIFSTYDNANVNLQHNYSSALNANATAKVIRQVLKPLQYTQK